MNWLDIALVIVLGWFTLSGLMAGLIREVFSLAGLILGVGLAIQYHQQLVPSLGFIESREAAQVVAFAGIFIAVGLVAHFLASILQRILALLFLGWANHLGGATFGLLKGAMILDVALQVILRLPFFNLGGAVTGSGVAQLVISLMPSILRLIPFDLDPSRWFPF